MLTDAHDLVYENVTFSGAGSGWGASSGVIFISGASYNITFRNCVIKTNQDGVGNGVKIYDTGRGIHDITFEGCTFEYQPRMSFECIGRSNPNEGGTGGKGYQRVNLINCTFEPAAGQNISYDDNYSGTANRAGNCIVSGNVCKGAGVGRYYQYAKVFENNGVHDMTVTGNTFWMGRDGCLNLQGRDSRDWNLEFSNNIVDCTKIAPGIEVDYSVAQPVVGLNVIGGRYSGNTVRNLQSWNVTWFDNCHNMDWRTTTWLGPNNTPYQTSSCSGNLF